MLAKNFMFLTDGYKLDHRRQYPQNTQYIYSNFTPRASRTEASEVVFFGLQGFLKEYLQKQVNETFFNRPKQTVLDEFKRFQDNYLGPNNIGIDHIADLYDYGTIPLAFYALPEGTKVPLRFPMFTVENTEPSFYWVTNYFETLISVNLWKACTSATTAYRYRKMLNDWADRTGASPLFVPYQGHDFSFRGMSSLDDAIISGAAHLLSFNGTDTIPAIPYLEEYYDANLKGPFGVPATEHSVMCAGGKTSELETFKHLIKLYPSGIVSIVSDTWDFWNVIQNIVPQLKRSILERDGKVVLRPDSGDPVKVICGDPEGKTEISKKGAVESLWDIFGGTSTLGYKLLDQHIGIIYGDSITYERARTICENLAQKGFSTGNVVLGIGSFTYQYVTRDTYGHAIKATWAMINNNEHQMYKDPITDDGTKKSAKGRIAIVKDVAGKLSMIDGLSLAEHQKLEDKNELKLVWKNGVFYRTQNFENIKNTLYNV